MIKKISILNKKKSKLKPGSPEINDVHKEIRDIYHSDVNLYKFDNGLISFFEDFYKLENPNLDDVFEDDDDVFYYSEIEILED